MALCGWTRGNRATRTLQQRLEQVQGPLQNESCSYEGRAPHEKRSRNLRLFLQALRLLPPYQRSAAEQSAGTAQRKQTSPPVSERCRTNQSVRKTINSSRARVFRGTRFRRDGDCTSFWERHIPLTVWTLTAGMG